MRIVAGRLGGRTFEAPHGHRTHPMSERVRGAIFNALGDIDGLTVLDAYAGSGALSFEALSRGAISAYLIELDKHAAETAEANARQLGLQTLVKVTRANATAWSTRNQDKVFDLLFCDPPYDQTSAKDIQALTSHLKSGGLLILSWPGSSDLPTFEGLNLLQRKDFGDAQLGFYRHGAS
jgi:16S rRNA (guanine966-N2)-methyltransferase